MNTESTFMMDAALSYAECGFKVFPCKPNAKTPITANGFKDATTDEDTITKWWTANPEANIGLPCAPNGLLAIDLDYGHIPNGKSKDYVANSIDAILEEIDCALLTRTDWVQLTPSGGKHLVYDLNGQNFTQAKLSAEIDVRHDGYILAHPSKVDGIEYTWAGDFGFEAPKVTPELASKFRELQARFSKASAPSNTAKTKDAVEGRIPEGCRNSTMVTKASQMQRILNPSYEELVALLNVINETRCDPPLPLHVIEQICRSINGKEGNEQEIVEASSDKCHFQTPKELAAQGAFQVMPILWRDRIGMGQPCLIHAPPNAGKTTLACIIVKEIVKNPDVKVAWFSIEGTANDSFFMWDKLGMSGDFHLFRTDEGKFRNFDCNFADKQMLKMLREELDELGINVIVVDSLSRMFNGVDLNDGSKLKDLMCNVNSYLGDSGKRAILYIHHDKKQSFDEVEASLSDALGSTMIGSAIRSALSIKARAGKWTIYHTRSNGMVKQKPLDLNYDQMTGKYSFSDATGDCTKHLDDFLTDYIRSNNKDEYSYSELSDALEHEFDDVRGDEEAKWKRRYRCCDRTAKVCGYQSTKKSTGGRKPTTWYVRGGK